MRVVLILIAVVLGASACGGSATDTVSNPPADAVQGVYLRAPTSNDPGKPAQGVVMAAYTRPISTAGPIMVDPPSPIAQATTDADGSFVIHVPGHKRVFVAPLHDRAYTVGKWITAGGPSVTIVGCTRCLRPLASQANTG